MAMWARHGLDAWYGIRESGQMRPPWRVAKEVLPSERGLLELANRELDLPLGEVLQRFRALVSADMDWVDSRKTRFRRRASTVKIVSLLLTAVSTVVLGIEAMPSRASICTAYDRGLLL